MPFEKVFGVGLNKTGTTTLADMLGQLELRHQIWSPTNFNLYQKGRIKKLLKKSHEFDSFTDWPWPLMVDELLEHYADRACYILTRRVNADVWIESLKGHALATMPGNHARQAVYGYEYPHENERAHIRLYEDHLEKTRQLFVDNNLGHALLEVCWEENDGWDEVARFLQKPAPSKSVPHHNSKKSRRKFLPHRVENLQRIGSLVAH